MKVRSIIYPVVIFSYIFILSLTGIFGQDIHNAVRQKNTEKMEVLLAENPLLVNAEDSNGRTPFMIAVMANNKAIAELLIKKGAIARLGDKNGRSQDLPAFPLFP